MTPPSSMAYQKTPFKPWRAHSIPIDTTRMCHSLCGLLNRLTNSNFDVVCDKVVYWAISVDRVGDLHALECLVRTVFAHALADPIHSKLYAGLCQRVTDELEGERSLWKKVDVYHLGNPIRSFETDIRLLAQDELRRILGMDDANLLYSAMSFAGELLVHGIIIPDDAQEVVDTLFDHAERNDEEHTVALCRFLARVVCAFDAYRLLSSLHVVEKIERVLAKERLSHKTRYLLMSMLEQVVFPCPQDAFGSTSDRVDVYGVDLDDSDAESVDGEDLDNETDRVRRACTAHTAAFLDTRDRSRVLPLLVSLKPAHRGLLVQELVEAALSGGDTGDVSAVGSLFFAAISADHNDVETLVDGLQAQIALLEDTVLDVPNAPHLVAHLLHATGLAFDELENIAKHSLHASSPILAVLLAELRVLRDCSESDTEGDDTTDSAPRRNRFERVVSP